VCSVKEDLDPRTAPPKEEEMAQGTIAQMHGNLGGFGSGVLVLKNGSMGMCIPGPAMGMPQPGMGGPDM